MVCLCACVYVCCCNSLLILYSLFRLSNVVFRFVVAVILFKQKFVLPYVVRNGEKRAKGSKKMATEWFAKHRNCAVALAITRKNVATAWSNEGIFKYGKRISYIFMQQFGTLRTRSLKSHYNYSERERRGGGGFSVGLMTKWWWCWFRANKKKRGSKTAAAASSTRTTKNWLAKVFYLLRNVCVFACVR